MFQESDSAHGSWSRQHAHDFCAALLAMAGHDLRQPLQILIGMHGWLDRRLTGDSEREYLRRGGLAIAQLKNQLDQLTDGLRLYERASSLDLVPVPVTPILSELLMDHIDMARSRGIELRICPTSRAVMSDPTLLAALLRNLVQNALKYTPPGKGVLIGCRARGPETSIEVHDAGIGIPAAQLSRVFDSFHQVDPTRSDGLGLGLYIVKKIAELLGHGVHVRSEVGRGSCFAVRAGTARGADIPRQPPFGGVSDQTCRIRWKPNN
jgi:two-component system, OmpR family, phosphate regulon sensor histidine kinase PhoR